jgi:hypothetical protein
MQPSIGIALAGAAGSVAFFAFLAFASWTEYRKNKDEREAERDERMKALEIGYPPLDAEIERAKAYASAAWAAGLIGILVPITVLVLTFAGTIVAVLNRQATDNLRDPLAIAWSIAAVIVLVTVVRSLSAIRQLPRPTGEPPQRTPFLEKPAAGSSSEFQGAHSEI